MRLTGSFYLALWGVLSLTHSVLAANEAFGSLMLFLYNAYRFDEVATNGKPGLADKCKPQDVDGPGGGQVNKGCNFHGFLRHVLAAPYDPKGAGFDKVSDPWMPMEAEVVDMQKWDGVDAAAGYDAGKVMGSSGNYFNSHLVFRVVAARVKKLAQDKPAAAEGVYGGMLDSVDRIHFAMRSESAGKLIKTTEGLLGSDKGKLKTSDVGGLYGLPGYKKVDLKATAGTLDGDKLSGFQSSMRDMSSSRLENDKELAFRDVVLLRDELSMGPGDGGSRCGGYNRDSKQRDEDDKKDDDEKNQACKKKDKRGFLGSLGGMLFERQNGNGGGNNCVTKTETEYVTQGHHTFTPEVYCDPTNLGQACYNYRSVMSVHKATNSWTEWTCRDGTSSSQDGKATGEWGSTAKGNGIPHADAQHNYYWSVGLPPTRSCERDEWPPRYFLPKASSDVSGISAQRMRFLPKKENGDAGKIWSGFCAETAEYGPTTGYKKNPKDKKNTYEKNTDHYLRARPAVAVTNLGRDKTMTVTTTSYVKTPRPVFSLKFDDALFTLPNDGLDDNPCIPDIVRGTDPGWALLTYDEYYQRNPHLKMYASLYNKTDVPAALPAQPAPKPAPAPPRRLRRGTRADWDEVVLVDVEGQTYVKGGMDMIEEMEEEEREAMERYPVCTELEDPSEVAWNPDVDPTPVPGDEGEEWYVPGAESRQTAPGLPEPTGA